MKYNLKYIAAKLKLKHVKFYKDKLTARCISGTHDDEHPSMVIFDDGTIFCSACKFKSNIETLNAIDEAELNRYIDDTINIELPDLELKEIAIPKLPKITFPYKEISLKTLHFYDVREMPDGIIIPIKFHKKIVGYYMVKDGKKLFSKDKTMWGEHFSTYVYPYTFPEEIKNKKYIILVEGIFDALALIDRGFKATCCFGTSFVNNFKIVKRKALAALSTGAEKIFVWFDNDEPGREASEKLYKTLREAGFNVKALDFDLPGDPDENVDIVMDDLQAMVS